MRCERCGTELEWQVHQESGFASMVCSCRAVNLMVLGVAENGEYKRDDNQPAGVEANTGSSGPFTGRIDSVKASERAEEAAAEDEDEVDVCLPQAAVDDGKAGE